MKKRNVIIDCDTGVDDALALLLALRSPDFNVLGITNVAGNVPIDKVVRNTLVVVEHSGKQVPVHQGAYRALLGAGETAEYAHGQDGLGDIGFPEPKIDRSSEHAVDYLIRSFMESTQPIDLITLAPLTNIAIALQKERRLEERINSLIMMAGGIECGNSTPAAEFNVWADPEAADIVFRSRIHRKTIVPLDPNRQGGGIYPEDVDRLETSNQPWCRMAAKLLRVQLKRWENVATQKVMPATPPDLAAMGVALNPALANIELMNVVVETSGKHTRGMTVIDQRPYRGVFRPAPEPNINVVYTIDNPRYRKLILDTWLS
jgi:inosine-uridine nucleoside N-ribohydrolase